MHSEFHKHISDCFPELIQGRSIIACSGGLDSVLLVHLCAQSELDFAIAHCNFQLRREESNEDEVFVRQLADQLKVKYFVKTFNTKHYASLNKLSIQMAARELRYNWFEELARDNQIPVVMTAHHADDNLETFLINLSRGTGIKGLTGIPVRSGSILRPLLIFSREELKAYALDQCISWREDSSNKEKYYLRNKIRHDITPLLKQLHPTFLKNFKQTQLNLGKVDSILHHYVTELKSELFVTYKSGWKIEVNALKDLNPLDAYLFALFSEYGFTEWNNVQDLLSAPSGKEVRSKTHRLIKDRNTLLLVNIEGNLDGPFDFKLKTGDVHGPVPMVIDLVSVISERSDDILYVDKETLNHRLQIRKWKKGDYFYPLGMKGRKLVSKYFKDAKLNALQKEDQWLLYSGDQLVWIIGQRADDRFKVGPQTKEILRFQLVE